VTNEQDEEDSSNAAPTWNTTTHTNLDIACDENEHGTPGIREELDVVLRQTDPCVRDDDMIRKRMSMSDPAT